MHPVELIGQVVGFDGEDVRLVRARKRVLGFDVKNGVAVRRCLADAEDIVLLRGPD